MIELWQNIIDVLNANAGVVSFFALLAAVIVPWVIYRKNKKAKLQEMLDEYEAREEYQGVAMPSNDKEASIRRRALEKGLKRGRK